jgi:tetratricopeptide (TPR) repeat protein
MPGTTLTLSNAIKRAVESYRAGRFDQTEILCKDILRTNANHFGALHLLAVIQFRLGRLKDALESYDRALAIKQDYAEALNNRGNALRDLTRLDDALASYEKALAIKPDFVEALYNRGTILKDLKRFADAVASYDQALAIKPDFAEALNNRGNALRDSEVLWRRVGEL